MLLRNDRESKDVGDFCISAGGRRDLLLDMASHPFSRRTRIVGGSFDSPIAWQLAKQLGYREVALGKWAHNDSVARRSSAGRNRCQCGRLETDIAVAAGSKEIALSCEQSIKRDDA